MGLPEEARALLAAAPRVLVAESVEPFVELAAGDDGWFELAYDVPGRGRVVEATAARVRNGTAANHTEAYTGRRDPDALLIAAHGSVGVLPLRVDPTRERVALRTRDRPDFPL